jgi:uncharacterized protein with HEPN domain
VRNFEIIGEAANKLSDGLVSSSSSINWADIVGFRHILIHNYFGVDYEIVWRITTDELPKLKTDIMQLVRSL